MKALLDQVFGGQMFGATGLTPHGFCLAWQPGLIWLHAGSDIVIALAYFSIPLALGVFARRRSDLAFSWMLWLFAAFILACGTTHALAAATLWVPAYWIAGFIKAITAALSLTTAVMLWPLIPKVLALPSPAALRSANAALEMQAREQEATARRLAESEERYRAFFTRAPAAMHSLNRAKRIVAVSDHWLEMLGYTREEVVGRPVTDFQEPAWMHDEPEGTARDPERRFIHKSGAVLDVLLSCTVEGDGSFGTWRSICVLTDVTARKRAEAALQESEARLRQIEKLSALGQLAGGIAHDFNNVLQAVHGGATLIARRAEDTEGVRRLAAAVIGAIERGTAITRRLLLFARHSDLRAEPVDGAALLAGVAEILIHTLGRGIEVRVESEPNLPKLFADKGQLETVLINLATNARDAMEGAGTLTLTAAAETLLHDNGPRHPLSLKAGVYVRLSVADTGCGMDAQTLARALEPLFTTKPPGMGTGLGLPMAQGFAEQSGGGLHIESTPGLGTIVNLWFPIAEPAHADGVVPCGEPAVHDSGDERARILLVDDEDLVREFLAEELESFGYTVLPTQSGAEALALLESGEPVALLLADLSMPGMDGIALIREAQRRFPDLPAILLTGFAARALELDLGAATGGTFSALRKPISGELLANRVARLLKGTRARAPEPPPV
ncbi:MAG: response regulator [Alphaproteobacteria bacterium]|nr:response regulator [Alphaproteobacteria bacterium]